jgi:hypothetical protein
LKQDFCAEFAGFTASAGKTLNPYQGLKRGGVGNIEPRHYTPEKP